MNHFTRQFLCDRLKNEVQVAVFGKHPAWDDHIDDIGLSTNSLALTKHYLYVDGIAKQLAEGVWDRLLPEQLAEFDHRFVWTYRQRAISGVILASTDGKGRARFPIVFCCQAGVSGRIAVISYLDLIEQLALHCREFTAQAAVREAVLRMKLTLNSSCVRRAEPADFPSFPESSDRDILLQSLSLVADQIGRAHSPNNRGSHFRLPGISKNTKENLIFWCSYCARLAPDLTSLVISIANSTYVDLIIGEPSSTDFFCLRSNLSALPLTATLASSTVDAKALEYLEHYRTLPHGISGEGKRFWWRCLLKQFTPP